jgi:hypothetical protein
MKQNGIIMGQKYWHDSNSKVDGRHEINMVKITEEGKEINEKNRSDC